MQQLPTQLPTAIELNVWVGSVHITLIPSHITIEWTPIPQFMPYHGMRLGFSMLPMLRSAQMHPHSLSLPLTSSPSSLNPFFTHLHVLKSYQSIPGATWQYCLTICHLPMNLPHEHSCRELGATQTFHGTRFFFLQWWIVNVVPWDRRRCGERPSAMHILASPHKTLSFTPIRPMLYVV